MSRAALVMLTATCGLAATLLTGCDAQLSFGRRLEGPFDDGGLSDTAVSQPPRPPFSCTLHGPLLDLDDGAEAACGDDSHGFHHALCACEDVVLGGATLVDGFDSRVAPYAAGEHSGSLAANRALYLNAPARIGGSLVVAGSTGIPDTRGDLVVGGNLLDQGPLLSAFGVTVDGRAEVAGDVRLGSLDVAGSFTLAATAALEVRDGAPPVVRRAVSVAPACRCDAPLDLATIIRAARADNDNAAIALDAANGLKAVDSAREQILPCGRYYVSELYAAHPLTLRIQGRVALYVDSDVVVENTGALTIALEGAAELDLFVLRGLSSKGPVEIGTPRAPTRTRLHFGASYALSFEDRATIAATLHAPLAQLVTQAAPLELYGSSLVRSAAAAGPLTLHYDRALNGDSCVAASCTRDTDCVRGLRCDGARCLP